MYKRQDTDGGTDTVVVEVPGNPTTTITSVWTGTGTNTYTITDTDGGIDTVIIEVPSVSGELNYASSLDPDVELSSSTDYGVGTMGDPVVTSIFSDTPYATIPAWNTEVEVDSQAHTSQTEFGNTDNVSTNVDSSTSSGALENQGTGEDNYPINHSESQTSSTNTIAENNSMDATLHETGDSEVSNFGDNGSVSRSNQEETTSSVGGNTESPTFVPTVSTQATITPTISSFEGSASVKHFSTFATLWIIALTILFF